MDFGLSQMTLTAELVKLCERYEPDPGPRPDRIYFSDKDYDGLAENLLRQFNGAPLWIFAYGSLLWKPEVSTVETVAATAVGWQRSFCLEIVRWRGSPAQPGLMMGLKRGGRCEGAILRLPDEDCRRQLGLMVRREITTATGIEAIQKIEVQTVQGPIQALVFWAEPEGCNYFVDYGARETAAILARACGHIGSGAAYLYETVRKLEELGIRDDNLWTLQRLVAEEILHILGQTDFPSDSVWIEKFGTSPP